MAGSNLKIAKKLVKKEINKKLETYINKKYLSKLLVIIKR